MKGSISRASLSGTDYAGVLSCIEAVYQCRSLDDFPRHVLTGLRKLVGCHLAGYNEVHLHRNRALIVLDPPLSPDKGPLFAKFESLMHQHPVINYFNTTGDGQTLKISDFLGAREFHGLPLYRDVYRHVAVEDQISFSVLLEPGFIIGIALNRDKRTFTEKDRLRLNLVRPHIIQAYLRAAEIAGHLEKQRDFQAVLRESGLGVIALDPAGGIIHATPRALECIAGYMPVPESDVRRLPPKLLQWALGTDALENGAAPFTINRERAKLTIRKVRQENRVLLLLSEDTGTVDEQQLARYQLTQRESEVLRWLAEGKSNFEIASILGLAAGTVKVHVERILSKLGTENRTAAALAVHRTNP